MNDSVNKQASALVFIERMITQVHTIMSTSMTALGNKYRTFFNSGNEARLSLDNENTKRRLKVSLRNICLCLVLQ